MNVTYNCTWRGRCSTYRNDWKKFAFNFLDDRAYEVSPDAYLQEIVRGGTTYCQVAIYGNRHNASEYILGDVFMQAFYVVLDYDNARFAVNGNFRTV